VLVNVLILVFAIGRCALVLARWRKEERGRSLERDSCSWKNQGYCARVGGLISSGILSSGALIMCAQHITLDSRDRERVIYM
jgi:hypothetical protein